MALQLYKFKPGEIIYCNLTFKTSKNKTVVSSEQIYSREYDQPTKVEYSIAVQSDKSFLKKHGVEENAEIIGIEHIKTMGYKNYNLPKKKKK